MDPNSKDQIYSQPLSAIKAFTFDENVAAVFDDMIRRSVPHYEQVQTLCGTLAQHLLKPKDLVIDLGCSTGETLARIAQNQPQARLIGVDNSSPMLQKARQRVNHDYLELRHESILNTPIDQAEMVILNYTLQFIPRPERPTLLKKIYHGLTPEGLLILSEKVQHEIPVLEQALQELHTQYKRHKGYSDLEIAQKREALLHVLTPLSLQQNTDLLIKAGFDTIEIALKGLNFACLIAQKNHPAKIKTSTCNSKKGVNVTPVCQNKRKQKRTR